MKTYYAFSHLYLIVCDYYSDVSNIRNRFKFDNRIHKIANKKKGMRMFEKNYKIKKKNAKK